MAGSDAPVPASLTSPESQIWEAGDFGHLRWEKTVRIGSGERHWRWASEHVLRWGIKTRSGFSVIPALPVAVGQRPVIRVNLPGARILEPVEVISVVETTQRVGFAYRTLAGHPVSGEECFVIEQRTGGNFLTIRSLTRPSDVQPWRGLFPLLRAAQLIARYRYFKALRTPGSSRAGGSRTTGSTNSR
ncbi:DUF1990 domain-containing protein [Arthrobacter sp. MYb224]|uniref:DUF1990 family protein n=1 Tax=Arthrobacter sp. MYb224 TaxID=1848600 RepID=UPI000CFC8199|nr:DUF1990 family protein [Arthrobacter sp. MYb224]PRA01462.1 DUF1990 domain-containing protein [Arthrobacter sp. MYb224]